MANRAKGIYCDKCKKPLGVIRKASLMVGIVYLCPKCKEKKPQDNPMPDFLKDIFPPP